MLQKHDMHVHIQVGLVGLWFLLLHPAQLAAPAARTPRHARMQGAMHACVYV